MKPSRLLPIAFLAVVAWAGLAFLLPEVLRTHEDEKLHNAARANDVAELQRILSEHHERIEARNRLQMTPLHMAVMEGHPAATSWLLSNGANIEATWDLVETGDGSWTPLHIASRWNRIEVADLLIRWGAKLDARTLRGETPDDIAKRSNSMEIAKRIDEERNRGQNGAKP